MLFMEGLFFKSLLPRSEWWKDEFSERKVECLAASAD